MIPFFSPFLFIGVKRKPSSFPSVSRASEATGFKCMGCAIAWLGVNSCPSLWHLKQVTWSSRHSKHHTSLGGPDRKRWWYSASEESAHLSRASLLSLFSSKGILCIQINFLQQTLHPCRPVAFRWTSPHHSLYSACTWICLWVLFSALSSCNDLNTNPGWSVNTTHKLTCGYSKVTSTSTENTHNNLKPKEVFKGSF